MPLTSPRFFSFWAINAPLEESDLCHQLDRLRHAGLDGVVFHPRFYPNEPPYLSDDYLKIVSSVIEHARRIGLAFWIYDENGWPSGTVGGQLLQRFPEERQRFAGLTRERPERALASFARAGRQWYLGEHDGPGVDYLSPTLAARFLELTHERYRRGLEPCAFDYVEAFFCDEPEFGLGHAYDRLPPDGAIPWTPTLEDDFRRRHGESLQPLLPHLFFDGPEAPGVRVKFWEQVTDLFTERFLDPLNAWCLSHGKRFTAHIKGEEHPLFQVMMAGSAAQVFQHLSLPGIDALERFPSNHFFPRQVSGVARQFGDGRCMAEAFGGAGWGAEPADLEQYLLWLGGHGVTDFVLHLQHFRLDSAAVRDWPPSQPLNLSWKDAFPDVLKRVRERLQHSVRPAADWLVVAPVRGLMQRVNPSELMLTNIHNAVTYPDSAAGRINRRFLDTVERLHRSGINYDFTDERTLERSGRSAGGRLQLGQMFYEQLWIDPACSFEADAGAWHAVRRPELPPARPPAVAVPPVHAPRELLGALVPHWQLSPLPCNRWPLDLTAENERTYGGEFAAGLPHPDARLSVVLLDRPEAVALNGRALAFRSVAGRFVAFFEASELRSRNRFWVRYPLALPGPVLWLEGCFHVLSDSEFRSGPADTLSTLGPFRLAPPEVFRAGNLVTQGYPFFGDTMMATTRLDLSAQIEAISFEGLQAATARLRAPVGDGQWRWPVDDGRFWPATLRPGRYLLELELVASGFNAFGPHRYQGGDHSVISPDQFLGRRNFADPSGVGETTHGPHWHFRRYELPGRLKLWR